MITDYGVRCSLLTKECVNASRMMGLWRHEVCRTHDALHFLSPLYSQSAIPIPFPVSNPDAEYVT